MFKNSSNVDALADCLVQFFHRNAEIRAFWEKVIIGHILPIFNAVFKN